MADGNEGNTPLVLDKAWMKKFIDEDIQEFQTAIKNISNDSTKDSVQSILNLSGTRPDYVSAEMQWPLVLGPLAEGAGENVQKVVKSSADQLAEIIEDQKRLFDDMESNMRDTMELLLKTEGDSLENIDGDKLLDVFEDVSDDLADSMGSGGEGDTDD